MTQNEKAARKKKIMHAVMWVVLLILFICFVAPFILVVINVFKTKGDITSISVNTDLPSKTSLKP